MTIRVGVVGFKHGMASIVEVVRNPKFRLVSVCSRSREDYEYLRGAEIAQPLDSVTFTASRESLIAEARRHCDFGGVAFFDDYDRFLAEGGVDAVILAVPVNLNARYGMKALKAGKHVLASKPFAIGVDEAVELYHAVRAARGAFVLNFEFRYSPLFVAIRRELDADRIGQVRLMSWNMFRMPFRPSYRRRAVSGGPFIAEICHWVDIFRFVEGRGRFLRAASFGGLDVLKDMQDFADHAASIVEYDSGAVGSINFTYFTDYPEHNVFAFVGDKGKIAGNTDGAGVYSLYRDGRREPDVVRLDPTTNHQGHLGFDRSHAYFAEVIEDGLRVNEAEAEAGLESTLATVALDMAMTEGRTVTREEIVSSTELY